MFFNLQGLGALPPRPPPVYGSTWIAYMNDKAMTSQWTSCPPNPPYGCKMINGFAWGQVTGNDEFPARYIAPPGGPVASMTPAQTSAADYCSQKYMEYAQAYPDKVKCLSQAQGVQIMAWCAASQLGQMTMETYFAKREALIKRACAEYNCQRQMAAWREDNPKLDRCLSSADRMDMRGWCVQWVMGTMSESSYQNHWNNRVAARCKTYAKKHPAKPAPSKPPSTPSGGGGSTPTPSDVLPSGGEVHDEGGSGGGGGDAAQGDVEPQSLLRQWGPVVGIGLLIALGLTVASQKKKRKKGRS